MHRRFQILSLFSLPFLLSGILFFVHRQERTARESFAQEEVRERWTRSAREALSHMQAGHSFEDQINLMGIRLNGFLMDSWGRSAGSYNLRVGKLLVSSFVRAFPRRHRPNGIVLYGFRIDNFGKIALVPGNKPGKGLSHGQERMLPELLEGFIALSRNQAPTGLSPAALTARCRGFLGKNVSPGLIGIERRGQLVPVRVADRVGFLLWNYLEISGKPFGGYAIFFPGNLKRRIKPLSYCLDRVFRESRGRLIPLLVPINPLLPGGKALVHPACKQLPGVRGLLTTARTKIDRERWFPLNRIREYDGLWAMRGFFSTDLAHEGWVVSRPPAPGRPPSEKTGRTEWGLFLGTWALIVFPFFAAGRLPSVSIKRTFPFFFFLVAAVPLSMMFSLGTYQIGSWKNRSITERGLEALESLSAIDGEFSDVVSEFTQRTKSLLNTPGWLDRMSSADAATETGAVEEAFHFFASSPSPLDLVLIYKPGKFSRGYSKDKALNRRDRSALDFFAGLSRALIYRCNRDQPMEEIFPLTQVQRRFTQMVEEKKILSSGGFEDTSEIGSIVRITGSWRYLGIPKLYSENGRVKVSFVLLSKAELAFSRFLKGRIAQLDLEHPQERWTLARLLPGNEELIGPSPGNSYWSSSQGRLMRTVMIRAANFRAPVLLERNERIIAAAGCPNLGDFVIGREIPFSDLSSQAQKQALILLSGLFSIGVISMALGQRVVSSMIEPLTAVERGLQELTSGRFPPPLSLERDDELGEMTRSFDSMVSGLRQRLKLGRFVSGSLEESFHTGRNDAAETDGLVVRAVVLASDLRNFTTISEGNPPEIVVEMLNQHLEEMSDEIQRFGGRIDKFIGDAIIAVFTGSDYGSPAFRAVSAGIGMRRRHDRIQADRRAKGLFTYEMGVGIDSGEVFIGTIGSLGRSDFTVFGPPRERAESLEGASKKGTATRIMISSKIRSEAGSCLEAAPRSDGIFEVLGLSPRPGAQE